MKGFKDRRIAMLAVLPIALLLINGFATAAQSQSLQLTLTGGIIDAGRQHYVINGGKAVAVYFNGLDLSKAKVHYSLDATVSGLSAKGEASLNVKGQVGGEKFSLQADITIFDAIPAQAFGQSMIPIFFVGLADMEVEQGTSHQRIQLPLLIESPYFNPFGGLEHPILISSNDPQSNTALFAIVTYDTATIDWSNVRLGGSLSGTLDNSAVSGQFVMVVHSHEDLVRGVERDEGTIEFLEMSNPVLNSKGSFQGVTTIPTQAYDGQPGPLSCASQFGLPEGTCTLTGAISTGKFSMSNNEVNGQNEGSNVLIKGTYNTIWTVPSLGFKSLVDASVKAK